MAELKTLAGGYRLWWYLPSVPAAALFVALFTIITAAVIWRMVKTKTWFVSVLVIGGFCKSRIKPSPSCLGKKERCKDRFTVLIANTTMLQTVEIIGFAARIPAREQTDKLMPYIIQNIFILLAPALFAASIYMVLGRIIVRIKGEAHSVVPVRWVTIIFVTGDVLSFLVQGTAGGLMATQGNMTLGENIVIGGLFIQIVVFGFFIITSFIFQRRMTRHPTPEAQNPASGWKKDLNMLYTVSVLIMVRSVFRVIEFIMGYEGYLLQHEWTLYVFDAVLMFFVMVIFFIRYPAERASEGWKDGNIPLDSRSGQVMDSSDESGQSKAV